MRKTKPSPWDDDGSGYRGICKESPRDHLRRRCIGMRLALANAPKGNARGLAEDLRLEIPKDFGGDGKSKPKRRQLARFRRTLVYRHSARDREGLTLNFCPFCGGKVREVPS